MNDAMVTPPETIMLARAEEKSNVKSSVKPKFELRVCDLKENDFANDEYPPNVPRSPIVIYPAGVLRHYLSERSGWKEKFDMNSSKITIIEEPQYAALEPYKEDSYPGGQGFLYIPQPNNWLGADQLTALVEFNGQTVRVKMDIVVVRIVDDRSGFSNGFSGGGEALDKIANECLFLGGYEHIQRVRIFSTVGWDGA
jgi:hypothetical protein